MAIGIAAVLLSGCVLEAKVDGSDPDAAVAQADAAPGTPDAAPTPDSPPQPDAAPLPPDAMIAGLLIRSVATGSDDAEEVLANGAMSLGSPSLEMGLDNGVDPQLVGIRFQQIDIPPGATINEASIQFQASIDATVAGTLTIAGEESDDPNTFTTTAADISVRSRLGTTVTWNPPAWSSGAAGADQQTPNLAPIVSVLVNRAGWASGNSIAFIISGDQLRDGTSFETGTPPVLTIRYDAP